MTGSPVLTRYVSEVASRCGLTLALYSRPHSSECAVSEHRAVIAALASNDVARATAVMDEHLEAVAGRALIVRARRASATSRTCSRAMPLRRDAAAAAASAAAASAESPHALMPAFASRRSALSFHTSICTILPPRTTKRST